MKNMSQIISGLNRKKLRSSQSEEIKKCRCKDATVCPLGGNCAISNIVYRATITVSDPTHAAENGKFYNGMTCQKFNERLRAHRKSFNNPKYKKESKLAEYIWTLKEKDIIFDLKWELVRRSITYKPGMLYCLLCALEKLYILNGDKQKMINSRSELMSKCIHKKAFLLENMNLKKAKTTPQTDQNIQTKNLRVMLNPLPKEIVRQHTLNAMPPSIETSHTLQIDTLGSIENHTQSIEILEPRRSARNRKPKVIFDI